MVLHFNYMTGFYKLNAAHNKINFSAARKYMSLNNFNKNAFQEKTAKGNMPRYIYVVMSILVGHIF